MAGNPTFQEVNHERHISIGREMGGRKARASITYWFLLCYSLSLGFNLTERDSSIEMTNLLVKNSDLKLACSHLFLTFLQMMLIDKMSFRGFSELP